MTRKFKIGYVDVGVTRNTVQLLAAVSFERVSGLPVLSTCRKTMFALFALPPLPARCLLFFNRRRRSRRRNLYMPHAHTHTRVHTHFVHAVPNCAEKKTKSGEQDTGARQESGNDPGTNSQNRSWWARDAVQRAQNFTDDRFVVKVSRWRWSSGN